MDFTKIFEGKDEEDVPLKDNPAAKEAAEYADRMAEEAAEEEREYQRKYREEEDYG